MRSYDDTSYLILKFLPAVLVSVSPSMPTSWVTLYLVTSRCGQSDLQLQKDKLNLMHKQPYFYESIDSYTFKSQRARFMGSTWGPPGSCRPQMDPMLAPWILLSGVSSYQHSPTPTKCILNHCHIPAVWCSYNLCFHHLPATQGEGLQWADNPTSHSCFLRHLQQEQWAL